MLKLTLYDSMHLKNKSFDNTCVTNYYIQYKNGYSTNNVKIEYIEYIVSTCYYISM